MTFVQRVPCQADSTLIPTGMKKYDENDGDYVLFGEGVLPSNQFSDDDSDEGGIESLLHNQDNEDQELPLLLIRTVGALCGSYFPPGVLRGCSSLLEYLLEFIH